MVDSRSAPSVLQQTDGAPIAADAIDGLTAGFGTGLPGRITFWIAVSFPAFQIRAAADGTRPGQVVRGMNVGCLLLGFALIANLMARTPLTKTLSSVLGLLGFGTGLCNWIFYGDIIQRTGFLTPMAKVIGVGRAGMLKLFNDFAPGLVGGAGAGRDRSGFWHRR